MNPCNPKTSKIERKDKEIPNSQTQVRLCSCRIRRIVRRNQSGNNTKVVKTYRLSHQAQQKSCRSEALTFLLPFCQGSHSRTNRDAYLFFTEHEACRFKLLACWYAMAASNMVAHHTAWLDVVHLGSVIALAAEIHVGCAIVFDSGVAS